MQTTRSTRSASDVEAPVQPDETRDGNQGLLDIYDAKSAGLVQADHLKQAIPYQLSSHEPLSFY